MFENSIFLKDINNYNFNFKKMLNKTNTIILFNCNNVNLNIKSKINKVILQKCKNINISIGNVVSGIEILKSTDVNIKIYDNKKINCLELFNSNIIINKLNYHLINENSYIYF